MDMVNAVNLKKYYVTDTYEVHALDGVSLNRREKENSLRWSEPRAVERLLF